MRAYNLYLSTVCVILLSFEPSVTIHNFVRILSVFGKKKLFTEMHLLRKKFSSKQRRNRRISIEGFEGGWGGETIKKVI